MHGTRSIAATKPWLRFGAQVLFLCLNFHCVVEAAEGGALVTSPIRADDLLNASALKAGLCVQVGAGDGLCATELARKGNFLVHVLAFDLKSLESCRSQIHSTGASAKVTVEQLPLAPLPYPANTANLLYTSSLSDAVKRGMSAEEVLRILTPKGIALLGGGEDGLVAGWQAKLKDAGVQDIETVQLGGAYLKFRKPRPQEMGDWPNYDCGADGNRVCRDTLVAAPESLKWIDSPTMHISHGTHPYAWVSAGGRVYYVYDERNPRLNEAGVEKVNLVARDAFNGLVLWRKPVPGKFSDWASKLCNVAAGEDRVFAPTGLDGLMQALDGNTGHVLQELKVSATKALLHEGKLILQGSSGLCVLDAKTGKSFWEQKLSCKDIAATGNRLIAEMKRGSGSGIAAYDLEGGQELWWCPNPLSLIFCHQDKVVLALPVSSSLSSGKMTLTAVSADTGKAAWTHECDKSFSRRPFPFYGIGDRIWYFATDSWFGLDLVTGKKVDERGGYVKGSVISHFVRCSGTNATTRFFITGYTMDFLDVKTNQHSRSYAGRSSCNFGIRTANGMAYVFPVQCGCFKKVPGTVGLAPAAENQVRRSGLAATQPRVITGPAYGKVPSPEIVLKAETEWPSYRHDYSRSGSNACRVPGDFKLLWKAEVGQVPTAPTAADGLVFVASKQGNRLVALDGESGKPRWAFATGGPLDTPPTVHGGALFFGAHDGWVYCLRASDGQLVWRFRAAPDERRIVAFGRLESPTPVFSSVLVVEGTVYCSAGYTMALDGGVHLYALDPVTGAVKGQYTEGAPRLAEDGPLVKRAIAPQGLIGDLLCSDGRLLYLDNGRFDLKDLRKLAGSGPAPIKPGRGGFLDSNMRENWFSQGIHGTLLVFNSKTVCGINALIGGSREDQFTAPGKGQYTLFAKPRGDGKGEVIWSIDKSPVAPEALALAGETLFLAGPPDALNPEGGILWALALADGRKIQELKLDSPPVFDGMAVAGGRLYLVTQDGKLLCFGK